MNDQPLRPPRFRWFRPTIVARLTILYAGLFATTAGLVVLGTYALVARSVVVDAAPTPQAAQFLNRVERQLGTEAIIEFRDVIERTRFDVLADLRRRSVTVYIAGVMLSTIAAWLLARRSLLPVRQLTEAAQNISATNLSQRITSPGPDDELKRLADTFDSMLGRLEQSFDSQRLFAAHASHELRTPLAALRAEAELAQAAPDDVEITEFAAVALRQTDRAEQLLASLLALARAESGARGSVGIDLGDLVGDVVAERAASADASGLTLDLSLVAAVVIGDEALLRALIVNLVSNAIAYNQPGGFVDVEVTDQNGIAHLRVSNSSRVLSDDEARQLARPFVRADVERQRVAGSGIGMAVVNAVAAAHKGTFTVVARPEGGLTATVLLPTSRVGSAT